MATAMGLVSLGDMCSVVWTGAEDKTAVESKSYDDQHQQKEDGRTTQTMYLESNDLGAPRKTICLVIESMRGWPANAHS
jgi:hypothetical protein